MSHLRDWQADWNVDLRQMTIVQNPLSVCIMVRWGDTAHGGRGGQPEERQTLTARRTQTRPFTHEISPSANMLYIPDPDVNLTLLYRPEKFQK